MKRSLFSLALVCLAAAAAVPATAQINTNGITQFDFGPFNLAEAYPCTAQAYPLNSAGNDLGIAPLQVFNGTGTSCANSHNNTGSPTPTTIQGAAPGILALSRRGTTLNVNCFAVTPSGEFGCVVQAFRFFKMVPGSFKCPDVYGQPHFVKDSNGNLVNQPYTYVQFGSGIRTWWALNFTQPGTRFLLQVVSACQFQPTETITNSNGTTSVIPVPGAAQQTHLHLDSWRWRVTADASTMLNVINLMHNGAVSTLEIPCILGEDMYDALVSADKTLANDVAETTANRLSDVGNAIFNMEALIVANCLFVEVLSPLVAFPGPNQTFSDGTVVPGIRLPPNAAQTVSFGPQGSAVAGIIDTIEHPCCCKLLVDLEWIAISNNIIGQTPTLPTF